MRVLHVITKLDFGGAQTVVKELALGMARSGDHVEVATGLLGPDSEELGEQLTVHHLDSLVHLPNWTNDRAAYRDLRTLIKRVDPDVVHAHSSKAGIIARVAGRRLHLPVVYTAHGWPFQTGVPLAQRAVSFLGETASSRVHGDVVCVSESDFEMAKRLRIVPAQRLHLIHNGVKDIPNALLAKPGSALGSPLHLVMLARHAAPKRHDLLLNALHSIRDRPWQLTLIGDGPRISQTRQLVDKLDLGERVTFVEPPNSPAEILATADLGILLSDFEGLPISVLEYLRAGLPVLGTNIAALQGLVSSANGWLVEATGDAAEKAITQIITTPELLADLGRRSRAIYETGYSSTQMIESYRSLYKSAIATQRST